MILSLFAIVVGQLTASRVRSDFNNENVAAAGELTDQLQIVRATAARGCPSSDTFAALNNAVIRIVDVNTGPLATPRTRARPRAAAAGQVERGGYRIVTRQALLDLRAQPPAKLNVLVQYARPVSDLESTIDRVRLFLALGVLAGTGLGPGPAACGWRAGR